MKKILFCLVALMLVVGCGGGGSPLSVTDMAGSYSFTKLTGVLSGATVTMVPPNISGSLSLTAASRYTIDIYFQSEHVFDTGAFSVSDPNITLVSNDGSSISGTISNDGKRITLSGSEGGTNLTMEFTKI